VDVSGVSKGKGHAGVMKRHHFHGGAATHGQSDRARRGGSTGDNYTWPSVAWVAHGRADGQQARKLC